MSQELRRIKYRPNIPLRGEILSLDEKDFPNIDNEGRFEFDQRRRMLLKEAFYEFLDYTESLSNIPRQSPYVNLSYRFSNIKNQNEIVQGITDYLKPPKKLYLQDYTNKRTNIQRDIQRMKDAKYFDFIEKNCFIYEDVKQYIYVNPIITKFLVEIENFPKSYFVNFKSQRTIDDKLYIQGSSAVTTDFRDLTMLQNQVDELKNDMTKSITNANERLKSLIEEKQIITQKFHKSSKIMNDSDIALINNLTRQIFQLDNQIRNDKMFFNTRISKIEEMIQNAKNDEVFNYNTPHSVLWGVGQIPLCDKNPVGLRDFDIIYYIDFYTDGSAKVNEKQRNIFESASAVYIPLVNKTIVSKIDHLTPELSSFRSELYAILIALRWFNMHFYSGDNTSSPLFNLANEYLTIPRILTDNYFCVFILNKCLNKTISEKLINGEDFNPDEILLCDDNEIYFDITLGKSKELFRNNYQGYLYDNLEIISEIVQYRFTLEFVRGHKSNFGNSVADMFAKYTRINKNFRNFEVFEFNLNV